MFITGTKLHLHKKNKTQCIIFLDLQNGVSNPKEIAISSV